ncbi:hypothetical protein GCM10020358_84840 [Amorphoplanes nipponensis]|uniref:Uncharacterized protein n=1 Tax=Actinoplanes nipponensis TaxID=135950 RepID=A0A919MKP1_9ACTN|nr:hypothetical protein Ani05nite_22450 [Actinoplanes nipponensis]
MAVGRTTGATGPRPGGGALATDVQDRATPRPGNGALAPMRQTGRRRGTAARERRARPHPVERLRHRPRSGNGALAPDRGDRDAAGSGAFAPDRSPATAA